MATVIRRRALAALAPLLGAGAGSRLLSGEAAAQHPPQISNGHDTGGYANGHPEHAGFRRGGRVDHARAPGLRDAAGRVLDRAVAGDIAGGMLVMYATGLVVSA